MRVFPFSNFSIKTIESPVTYAYGAKLYAQYSVMLEGNNQSTGAVLIFGPSGALFNLTQGSMTKSFDLAADKTIYRLNEGSKMGTGSFQLDVKFGVSGFGSTTITIKSQEYWMPLNAGFDLRTAGDREQRFQIPARCVPECREGRNVHCRKQCEAAFLPPERL